MNSLNASGVVAVGNGVNDRLMLKAAVLGILVVEGTATLRGYSCKRRIL